MISFRELYATAVLHKGGESAVESLLPKAKSASQLRKQSDAYYLSSLCLRIFRAGLKHDMVDRRWPAFEQAFNNFDPFLCAMLSDDELDVHMSNKSLIRHLGKIKSIRANGLFLQDVAKEAGSFGQWLADWPVEDTVGLWLALKKRGSQLGGMSGPYFLRMVGKDTFLITRDVAAVLVAQGVVEKAPTSQKELKKAEDTFKQWREECGRPYCEISRIVSMSTF